MSKAIIKKGSLSLIYKETSAGSLAYIINEDQQIVKSATTGLWLGTKFHKCDPNNGSIAIPKEVVADEYEWRYGCGHEVARGAILVHNDFAEFIGKEDLGTLAKGFQVIQC